MSITVPQSYKDKALAAIRKPRQQFRVSWDRSFDDTVDIFTLDTSVLDGTDILGGIPENVLNWDKFAYVDESEYVTTLICDRQQTEPIFSVARSMLDVTLDNNSGRFTPGGGSDIEDYIKTRRPVRAFTGFTGESTMPQLFVGEFVEAPVVSIESRTVQVHARDFMERIWNFPLKNTAMYTDVRSDELIETLLGLYGIDPSELSLQRGLNTISFAYFKKDDLLGPILQKIVEAELGWLYMDENGVITFENRTGLLLRDTAALTITDSMVINERFTGAQNIINVVEVTAKPREVRSAQPIFSSDTPMFLPVGVTEFFVNYQDPIASFVTPTAGGAPGYTVNSEADYSGSDRTNDIDFTITNFSESSKITIDNTTGAVAYLNRLELWGSPAKVIGDDNQGIFIREQDDTSVDANEEQVVKISNDFIQSQDFAQALATIIIQDRKDASSYREVTIPAQPYLQVGDLVTRDSIDYYIQRKQTVMSKDKGFIDTLTLVNKTVREYFLLDVSLLDGDAVLLP